MIQGLRRETDDGEERERAQRVSDRAASFASAPTKTLGVARGLSEIGINPKLQKGLGLRLS